MRDLSGAGGVGGRGVSLGAPGILRPRGPRSPPRCGPAVRRSSFLAVRRSRSSFLAVRRSSFLVDDDDLTERPPAGLPTSWSALPGERSGVDLGERAARRPPPSTPDHSPGQLTPPDFPLCGEFPPRSGFPPRTEPTRTGGFLTDRRQTGKYEITGRTMDEHYDLLGAPAPILADAPETGTGAPRLPRRPGISQGGSSRGLVAL